MQRNECEAGADDEAEQGKGESDARAQAELEGHADRLRLRPCKSNHRLQLETCSQNVASEENLRVAGAQEPECT